MMMLPRQTGELEIQYLHKKFYCKKTTLDWKMHSAMYLTIVPRRIAGFRWAGMLVLYYNRIKNLMLNSRVPKYLRFAPIHRLIESSYIGQMTAHLRSDNQMRYSHLLMRFVFRLSLSNIN